MTLERRYHHALAAVVTSSDRISRARRELGGADRVAWVGTREHGLQGNTVGALADRGLVEVKVATRPYKRLVCRPTAAGREAFALVKVNP